MLKQNKTKQTKTKTKPKKQKPDSSQSFLENRREKNILLDSFYETSITLIPKPDKDSVTKENYRSVFLWNMDAKTLNRILWNEIQQYISRVIYYDPMDVILGM